MSMNARSVSRSANAGRNQAVLMQFAACTEELIYSAMNARWDTVLDGIDRRRQLLGRVFDEPQLEQTNRRAIEEAIAESERALWSVIAHAIADSRSPTARHSLLD